MHCKNPRICADKNRKNCPCCLRRGRKGGNNGTKRTGVGWEQSNSVSLEPVGDPGKICVKIKSAKNNVFRKGACTHRKALLVLICVHWVSVSLSPGTPV